MINPSLMVDFVRTSLPLLGPAIVFVGLSMSTFMEHASAGSLFQEGTDTIDVQVLLSMSQEDQKDVLRQVLEDRQEKLRNVSVTTLTRVYNAKSTHGEIGETVHEVMRQRDEFYKLGPSYRLEFTLTRPGDPPLYTSVSGYDSETGVSKMYIDHRDRTQRTARVGRQQDSVLGLYRYGRMLTGTVGERKRSYVSELLALWAKVSAINVDVDGEVRVETTQEFSKSRVISNYWFDSSQGYLLTRYESKRRWRSKGKEEFGTDGRFRDRYLKVLETKMASGLWLPMRFTCVNEIHTLEDGVATVYDTEVESISLGDVTKSDLEVDFGRGTQVVDMLKSTVYVVGVPTTSPAEEPAEVKRGGWWGLIGLNVALLCAYLIYRSKSRRREQPAAG